MLGSAGPSKISSSLAKRRQWLRQAKGRSTIQRLDGTTTPLFSSSERLAPMFDHLREIHYTLTELF